MKAGKCKLNPPENVEKFIKHRQERRGQIFSEKTVLYKLAAGSVKYLERAVCSQINKGSENDENDNLVFILLAVSDFGAAGILAGLPHGQAGQNRTAQPPGAHPCQQLGRQTAAPGRGGHHHHRQGMECIHY